MGQWRVSYTSKSSSLNTLIFKFTISFNQQAPHHQPSERRRENIMPAHQPRLYTGHQSHPYAHHHHHASSRVPTTSDSPGASAQRIHDMRCPAAFIGRPTTAASLLVPDLSTSQQSTSSAAQLVSIVLTDSKAAVLSLSALGCQIILVIAMKLL